jgi:hypothetical protein
MSLRGAIQAIAAMANGHDKYGLRAEKRSFKFLGTATESISLGYWESIRPTATKSNKRSPLCMPRVFPHAIFRKL